MDRLRVLACAAVATTLGACEPERPRASPPEEGDFCVTGAPLCVDDELALLCVDGVLVSESCPEHCVEMGAPFVDGVCSFPGCVCELEDPDGCSPLVSACASETELTACTLQQEPFTVDCAQHCSEQGFEEYARCEALTFETATCFCG